MLLYRRRRRNEKKSRVVGGRVVGGRRREIRTHRTATSPPIFRRSSISGALGTPRVFPTHRHVVVPAVGS